MADSESRETMKDFQASPIWAVTSYFDPLQRGHRVDVYREFRRRLGIPLVTVELSFGPGFDLEPRDADILIQLSCGSVLWQKERLLNLALRALPRHVEAVAWLDCDVVFQREDWPQKLLRRLDQYSLVQPFSRLYHLKQNELPENWRRGRNNGFESAAFKFARGCFPEEAHRTRGMSQTLRYAPGMAWAARRETLIEHALYDCDVLGGSDKLMFSAACGYADESADSMTLAGPHKRHYTDWAQRFWRSVQGRVSYVEGDLLHLWHGDLAIRRYVERYTGFERFGFDPLTDICPATGGAWRWNNQKPEMHAFVHQQIVEMTPLGPAGAPGHGEQSLLAPSTSRTGMP